MADDYDLEPVSGNPFKLQRTGPFPEKPEGYEFYAPTDQPAGGEFLAEEGVSPEVSTGAGKVVTGLAKGIKDWITTPGEVMSGAPQVEPETPGQWSETDQYRQNIADAQYAQKQTDFGASTAMNLYGTSAPFAPRGAVGVAGGRPPVAAAEEAASAGPFYSAVERAIAETPQNKASPEQWAAMLRNRQGITAEELEWTGLPEWLKEQKGPVTKQQLQDYIRANQVQVQDVLKGYDKEASRAQRKSILERLEEIQDRHNEINPEASDAAFAEAKALSDEANELNKRYAFLTQEAESAQANTRHATQVLPGGENYRELLLTLPQKELPPDVAGKQWYDTFAKRGGDPAWEALSPEQQKTFSEKARGVSYETPFTSSHFDEPNILAHIRFNDRVIDGKKTLFIEEVQSDWHQAGRHQGYQKPQENIGYRVRNRKSGNTSEIFATRAEAEAYLNNLPPHMQLPENVYIQEVVTPKPALGVPDAPFKNTWHELALKRAIRYAAENGYDQIAWTPGKVQADRYNLATHIDSVSAAKRIDGTYDISAKPKRGGEPIEKTDVRPEDLSSVVGKDLADKIVKDFTPTEEWGVKNRNSGNWSPRFRTKEEAIAYQNSLPATTRANTDVLEMVPLFKRDYKGLDLEIGGEFHKELYDVRLPSAAKKLTKKYGAKVGEGKIDVNDAKGPFTMEGHGPWVIRDRHGNFVEDFNNKQMAEKMLSAYQKPKTQDVHTLSITPQLRDAAVKQGFPLFADGGRITTDPLAGQYGRHTLDTSVPLTSSVDLTGRAWAMPDKPVSRSDLGAMIGIRKKFADGGDPEFDLKPVAGNPFVVKRTEPFPEKPEGYEFLAPADEKPIPEGSITGRALKMKDELEQATPPSDIPSYQPDVPVSEEKTGIFKPSKFEMAPDLTEAQLGETLIPEKLKEGVASGRIQMIDSGEWLDTQTGQFVPEEIVSRRPSVLPLTADPEGKMELAMPKMLDIFSNVIGGVVPGGGTVLGAGAVKRVQALEQAAEADPRKVAGVEGYYNVLPIPEDWAVRLNRSLKRAGSEGQAKNGAFEVEPGMWLGDINVDQWLARTEKILTPDEIAKARAWYKEALPIYQEYFGREMAPQMMGAWLVANQNATPSFAQLSALRTREQLLNSTIAKNKRGGLPHDRLMNWWDAMLTGDAAKLEQTGSGQKIYDFIDSALGKNTRTFYGDNPAAGAPAVADVHSLRDMGFIDKAALNWMTDKLKAQGKTPDEIKDFLGKLREDTIGGGPSETQYEWAANKMRAFTDELNKREFMGGGWTPAELQAVGWTSMSKMLGRAAETPSRAIESHIHNVAYELDFGKGAPYNERFAAWHTINDPDAKEAITKQILPIILDEVERITGAISAGRIEGTGAWGPYLNPSFKSRLVASPEVVKDVAHMIGYLAQQTEIMAYRPMKNGKEIGFGIWSPELADKAVLTEFWNRIVDKHPDLAVGFAPSKHPQFGDGIEIIYKKQKLTKEEKKAGKKPLEVGVRLERRLENELKPTARRVAEEMGLLNENDFNVGSFRAENESVANDWTKKNQGQVYRSWLTSRYGPDIYGRLEHFKREVLEPAIDAAIRQHTGRGAEPRASGGRASAQAGLATKHQANYRGGTKRARCSDCTMFRPPRSCTAVRGSISPHGLCDYFKRKR